MRVSGVLSKPDLPLSFSSTEVQSPIQPERNNVFDNEMFVFVRSKRDIAAETLANSKEAR